jgi:hypothetical protein
VADGTVVQPGASVGRRLIEADTEGLAQLILVLLALDWSGGTRSRRLAETEAALRRIRLLPADRISVQVNGQAVELPPALGGALGVHHIEAPVIVVGRSGGNSVAELAPRLAYPLAELLRAKAHADTFARILSAAPASSIEHGLAGLPDAQLAELFRTSVLRIHEVARAFRSRHRYLMYRVRPVLCYWIGQERAREIIDGIEEGNLDDLQAALQGLADELSRPVGEVLDACRQADSAWVLRDALCLDFATFNQALIALGPPYEHCGIAAVSNFAFSLDWV